MNRKRVFIVCLLLMIGILPGFTQDGPIKKIVTQLNKWTVTTPQEKVYLHMDKPFYATGQDVWFKAYITTGTTHVLSKLNNILNVELIDDKDFIKQSLKLPVFNGIAWGDFALPDDLRPGNYRIRAYTNFMRNAGDDYFFDKTIFIGNGTKGQSANNITDKKTPAQNEPPVKALPAKIDIQLFPEGGTIVNGLSSKVAFKATDASGIGADIKGVIKDNNNYEVVTISTSHFGMGYFVFTPEHGKTYRAIITLPDGTENTTPIPTATESGYALSINNSDSATISVKINTSKDIAQHNNEVILVAQQNGRAFYAVKTKLSTITTVSTMPKNGFATGIVQFTLFSASNQPLCERLVFVQNPDLLKLNLTTDKATYTPRQKVKLNLSAINALNKPVIGGFSIAVIDESKVQVDETTETTILSNILLSSDLKGYIQSPNYYFINPNKLTRDNLDMLMLTQGYRRFVWKQILDDIYPPQVFQPEKSIGIVGTIKTGGGKPIPNGTVTLFSTSNGFFMRDTTADSDGHFAFNNLIFKDSARFVVQGRTVKGNQDVKVQLDNTTMPEIAKNKDLPDMQAGISDAMAIYLKISRDQYLEQLKYGLGNNETLLKEVHITGKKTTPIQQHSSNLNGGGHANQILKGTLLSNCSSLSQCLSGLLMGVTFIGDTAYSSQTGPRLFAKPPPMLIIVDGVEMQPYFPIDNIDASTVETIESLRSPEYTSVYGGKGAGGVLVITTKRGGSEGAERYAPGIINYTAKGYYAAREFYSPKYDDPKTNTKIADLRSTIYWNPDIITAPDGTASFEYFNADAKGTYRVVVEGIDNYGNLGRQVYRYKVE